MFRHWKVFALLLFATVWNHASRTVTIQKQNFSNVRQTFFVFVLCTRSHFLVRYQTALNRTGRRPFADAWAENRDRTRGLLRSRSCWPERERKTVDSDWRQVVWAVRTWTSRCRRTRRRRTRRGGSCVACRVATSAQHGPTRFRRSDHVAPPPRPAASRYVSTARACWGAFWDRTTGSRWRWTAPTTPRWSAAYTDKYTPSSDDVAGNLSRVWTPDARSTKRWLRRAKADS